MTKARVSELALHLIDDNLDWRFDNDQATRDFALFVDGICKLCRDIAEELDNEKVVTE